MLNCRHLYYFWVVTKEGGFTRAADRLSMAVQTISAQVRQLEKALGHPLLKPAGRGVALTEAGHAAFARAGEIFQLGHLVPDEVREAASGKVARLAVGLSDGLSRLAAHSLLQSVLATSSLRVVCHEGEFEQLLAEPALRPTLDRWFVAQGLRPHVVGEFEDSALLAVLAARGLGVFPVSSLGAGDVGWMRGLRLRGRCPDVKEEIHAARSRRGQHHPLVLQVIAAARA
jgi:LysR family transcriptional activator of nhaA